MKIVSTSYVNTPEYNDPEKWLERISFYTGLLEELAKQYEVESIEQINYSGIVRKNEVAFHFLNFKKRKLLFPLELHRYLKKLDPDVVFVNGFIFPLQIIQLRLALNKKVKLIIFHRSEKPFKGIKRSLQKLAGKYVDAFLFASSEFGEQWIRAGIISDKKKIREVFHASSIFKPGNKEMERSTLSIDGSPVFLFVGRLDVNKDPITVVKGFINFLSFQPSAKLFMIYQTEDLLNEVKSLISKNETTMRSINLIGKVAHGDLQAWYNSADFIISGSHYEGGGIAVCEGMSCGCIPIITDIMSFRRMTGPGKCGFLYKAGDPDDLLSTLLKTNEINFESERKKVLQQFKNELSFESIAGKINRVINSL
jgi:glycosyltransferase involved in cell wall biosynthesis